MRLAALLTLTAAFFSGVGMGAYLSRPRIPAMSRAETIRRAKMQTLRYQYLGARDRCIPMGV